MQNRKPAADLAGGLEAIQNQIHSFEQKVDLSLAAVTDKILSNVFRLAEVLQARVFDLERSEASLKHRLSILEERLMELEKRLNIPPSTVQ
jgi:hypothetical protein